MRIKGEKREMGFKEKRERVEEKEGSDNKVKVEKGKNWEKIGRANRRAEWWERRKAGMSERIKRRERNTRIERM